MPRKAFRIAICGDERSLLSLRPIAEMLRGEGKPLNKSRVLALAYYLASSAANSCNVIGS